MHVRNAVLGMLLLSPLVATAQAGQPVGRVYGLTDTDIPTPVHSLKTSSDGAAIQAVIEFVKMAGVTGWTGATATGTIAFTGDPASYPATISLAGADETRMDVKRDAGTDSTIFNGERGVFVSAAGKRSSISSDITTLGFFGFVRLFSPSYPEKTSILSDQGMISIAGKSLHRITLDDSSIDGLGNPWKTVDLYVDPANGEIVETVAFVHLSSSDAALYTLETSFSGYAPSNGATLPRTISQSLNGQPQWTLSLSSIDLSTVPAASLFTF